MHGDRIYAYLWIHNSSLRQRVKSERIGRGAVYAIGPSQAGR
jgi:hypothetical protein